MDDFRAGPVNEACCGTSTPNGSINVSPIDQAYYSITTINDNIGDDRNDNNLKENCTDCGSSSSPSGTEFDLDN
ncbi:unnamed protein product [Parnassius apollo]|uniref:(apollo) hypothetical protein n=1 Tax=Parnassius apollo TaxID=110799 RepID=A0A8S3XF42_PARAO|nr:unnamed protein product [Parnassius apollo]